MSPTLLFLLCATSFAAGWFTTIAFITRDLAWIDRLVLLATSTICLIVVAVAGFIL